jgi:hypothetical protein
VSAGVCDGCRAEFEARRAPSWLPIALEFAEQNQVLFESKEGGEDHMLWSAEPSKALVPHANSIASTNAIAVAQG